MEPRVTTELSGWIVFIYRREIDMFKDYDDVLKQMEFEMQRCSAEAMRRLLELPSGSQEFWQPRSDVYETENGLIVRVEVAGIQKESLNVSLSADRRSLHVRGTRTEKHIDERPKTRYHQLEVYFGPFERSISLPEDVAVDSENLSATYRDGFLLVTLPKTKVAQISRTIPIEDHDDQASH
jgi:HSP20 family protein